MTTLVVEGVSRTFSGPRPLQALRDVSFEAAPGEVVGLLGANGAGKTTLIKIIATLLLPTSGTVRIGGHDVVSRPAAARARLSVVFGGDRGLYDRLSALDNLRFFGSLHGIGGDLAARAREALAQVGLADRAHDRVERFSRGMRQRLHLAGGLLVRSPLLLLDEPTIGLDTVEAERIRETVRMLAGDGTTVVLTSHYSRDIETLASRIVLLQRGVVTHDLSTEEFRRQSGHVAVAIVEGRGTLPRPAPDVTVTGDAGGWRMSLKITSWTGPGLRRIEELTAGHDVLDIRVEPVGIDAVLADLGAGRAAANAGTP